MCSSGMTKMIPQHILAYICKIGTKPLHMLLIPFFSLSWIVYTPMHILLPLARVQVADLDLNSRLNKHSQIYYEPYVKIHAKWHACWEDMWGSPFGSSLILRLLFVTLALAVLVLVFKPWKVNFWPRHKWGNSSQTVVSYCHNSAIRAGSRAWKC